MYKTMFITERRFHAVMRAFGFSTMTWLFRASISLSKVFLEKAKPGVDRADSRNMFAAINACVSSTFSARDLVPHRGMAGLCSTCHLPFNSELLPIE